MAKGDLFKRSLEAGTSFLDMTRERAESMVKEWVDAGDLGKSRAQKAVEQLLDRSRKASDELRTLIRKEIAVQLEALGVATKEDVARLEARIGAGSTGPGVADVPPSPSPGVSTAAAEGAAQATTSTRTAAPKKATAKKATATAKKGGAGTAKAAAGAARATAAGRAAAKAAPPGAAKKAPTPRKAAPGPGAPPRPGT